MLRHESIQVTQTARDATELTGKDLIGYMLDQRTGRMGPSDDDAEQEAEDFAALLGYRYDGCRRTGRRSWRSASGRRLVDRLGARRPAADSIPTGNGSSRSHSDAET